MTLLAIDPGRSTKGEASIGVCLLTWKGEEICRKGITFEQLISPSTGFQIGRDEDLLFAYYGIDEVVIENFVNNEKSRGGQTNGTSECIGAVEMICHLTRTPFTRQPPAALGPAKLHAPEGSWKPLKHLRHEDSAFLHGYEYLVRKGVLKPAGLGATM